jgi:hypothetical protein
MLLYEHLCTSYICLHLSHVSIPWVIIELLGHIVTVYLIVLESVRLFSKVAIPLDIPISK